MADNDIKLENNFSIFFKKLDVAIAKASIISGREIVNGAKRLSRVDTGQMRDSYKFESEQNGKHNKFSNTQKYFAYQEQGTKYIKPMNSYITTIDNRKSKIAKNYLNQINNETKKIK